MISNDFPSSVVFNNGKLKSIGFGKAENPSYSDISNDIPSEVTFDNDGRLETITFGELGKDIRNLKYKDGVLESVYSHTSSGIGGMTKFDSNGDVDPTSAPSVMRESYQSVAPDKFLENLAPTLHNVGLDKFIAPLEPDVLMSM